MNSFDALLQYGHLTLGCRFSFRGVPRSGTLNDLSEEERGSIGRLVPGVCQTLSFPLENFTPRICIGEQITIERGRPLRIGRITTDETTITLYLCNP